MDFKFSTEKDYAQLKTGCLVLSCYAEQRRWPAALPSATRKQLTALEKAGDINPKPGTALWIHNPAGLTTPRLLLLSCGTEKSWDEQHCRQVLDALARELLRGPAKNACIALPPAAPGRSATWLGNQLARALVARTYHYDHTRSKKTTPPQLKRLTLVIDQRTDLSELKTGVRQGAAIGAGINAARLLADLPANICTPAYIARQARTLARKQARVTARVLDEKQMDLLGMGALLSVSRGSDEAARLVLVEYMGAGENEAPTVLVGKGVTFDAGGISLKPGARMDEMKYDMCGAASVLGTLKALIELKAPVNVVGLMPCTENLPSGSATKPGDVVTSMSGTTIEVLNTDAEGRLVLCDALTYAQRYKPRAVIDIATLTGACIVALGHHNSALLSNHQALADKLMEAGKTSGDTAWQLPMGPAYQKQLHSNFADIANIGGPSAGTITAACFLSRFASDFHWAHLDIAGVAWRSGSHKGATGRPVALLVEYRLQAATQ